jgi:NAD(P)H-dependent FMN reductase
METMKDAIKAADCFLVVTCEYNHTIPPALSSMLGHFGGSNYAFKPSGIVTYSPSPWGGTRAAMALRPMLSELGCLPVSKICCFPNANEMFKEDGQPSNAEDRMLQQLPGVLSQLEWMACAMASQREACGAPTGN